MSTVANPSRWKNITACALMLSVFAGYGCGKDDDSPTAPGGGMPSGDTWASMNGPPGVGGPVAFAASGEVYSSGFRVMFRSGDDGNTWTVAGGLPMDPGDDVPVQIIEIVVTEADHLVAPVGTAGIIRSTDEGASWSFVTDAWISSVVAMPDGGLCAGGNGIYLSRDGGAVWTRVSSGPQRWIHCLAVDSRGHLYAGGVSEILRSIDGGSTWTSDPTLGDVYSIATDPADRIYAGAGSSGVLVSEDGGVTWASRDVVTGGSYMIHALAADRLGNVFTSTSSFDGISAGLYRSSDQGRTWVSVDSRFNDDNTVWDIDIGPDGVIYVRTDIAVYRSRDHGDTWGVVNVPSSFIAAVFTTKSGDLFAGASGDLSLYRYNSSGQLYHYNSSGNVWRHRESWAGVPLSFAENSGGQLFVGTSKGIMISTDGGETWVHGTFPLVTTAIMIDADDTIWAGTPFLSSGLYTSTDNGETWTAEYVPGGVYDIETFDGADVGLLATTDGVYRSSGGVALEGVRVTSLAVVEPKTVFAATVLGVFRSIDYGETFAAARLPTTNAVAVYAHSSGNVFASMLESTGQLSIGTVYRTKNGGDTWHRYDSGLWGSWVFGLGETPSGDLLAATFGLGVMTSQP